MKTDEYGVVVNDPETYREIATILKTQNSIVFAWTDNESTHLDILMAHNTLTFGALQRGMRASDLFVAVSNSGMFGFSVNENTKYPHYVGEKLGLGGANDTTIALANLINGVIGELQK